MISRICRVDRSLQASDSRKWELQPGISGFEASLQWQFVSTMSASAFNSPVACGLKPAASAPMSHDRYESPLETRYASAEMSRLWSAQRKHSTWRQLWVWLAQAEAEMGLPITPAQIEELRA